jgi:hypothetical protein
VEISCLICGKKIEIPQFIDTNNYDGQISCHECKALLKMKMFGGKVRKYELVERGAESTTQSNPGNPGNPPAVEEKLNVESLLKYIPLRDYLANYRASQLSLSLEHIEHIIDSKLEAAACAFKSWWENNRQNPQANAWLEAGWEVEDADLQRQIILFKRVKAR